MRLHCCSSRLRLTGTNFDKWRRPDDPSFAGRNSLRDAVARRWQLGAGRFTAVGREAPVAGAVSAEHEAGAEVPRNPRVA